MIKKTARMYNLCEGHEEKDDEEIFNEETRFSPLDLNEELPELETRLAVRKSYCMAGTWRHYFRVWEAVT